MGALSRYVERVFGFETRHIEDPLITQATTTAQKVFRNNPDRIMFALSNLGSSIAYVGFDNRVSSTRGFFLDANGGYLSMVAFEDGELVGYEIWIIAVGTTAIKTVEVEAA